MWKALTVSSIFFYIFQFGPSLFDIHVQNFWYCMLMIGLLWLCQSNMCFIFLRWEPADGAWAQPGWSGGGQVEVLPVHVIQGWFKLSCCCLFILNVLFWWVGLRDINYTNAYIVKFWSKWFQTSWSWIFLWSRFIKGAKSLFVYFEKINKTFQNRHFQSVSINVCSFLL